MSPDYAWIDEAKSVVAGEVRNRGGIRRARQNLQELAAKQAVGAFRRQAEAAPSRHRPGAWFARRMACLLTIAQTLPRSSHESPLVRDVSVRSWIASRRWPHAQD